MNSRASNSYLKSQNKWESRRLPLTGCLSERRWCSDFFSTDLAPGSAVLSSPPGAGHSEVVSVRDLPFESTMPCPPERSVRRLGSFPRDLSGNSPTVGGRPMESGIRVISFEGLAMPPEAYGSQPTPAILSSRLVLVNRSPGICRDFDPAASRVDLFGTVGNGYLPAPSELQETRLELRNARNNKPQQESPVVIDTMQSHPTCGVTPGRCHPRDQPSAARGGLCFAGVGFMCPGH